MTHRAIYVPRIEASVFIAMLKLRYVTNSSLNSTTRSIIRHPYFNQFTDKVRERERESVAIRERNGQVDARGYTDRSSFSKEDCGTMYTR